MNYLLIVIISIVILIVNIYFTRWVFRIDEIIEIQREQSKLLKIISENIQNNINPAIEEKNINVQKTSKFLLDLNFCPACQKTIHKSDKKCTNCGLVIFE